MDARQAPALTPEWFEILVTRELRKTGLSLERVARERLERLAGADDDYVLELRTVLRVPDRAPLRVLVSCRSERSPVDDATLAGVLQRVEEVQAEAGLLFATGGFRAGVVRAAMRRPVALFRVSDGRTIFDTGGWGAPGHYPAWLPAHLAELASPGPALEPRYEITAPGQASRILERLATPGRSAERPG